MTAVKLLAASFVLFLVFAASINSLAGAIQETVKLSELTTVAESSDFKSTSTSAQVVEYMTNCSSQADHVQQFVFGKTVEDRDMVGAIVATKAYELGQQDDRVVTLVLGNIHSGECAGKEAILMMLRELASNPNHAWLKNMVLIFVPNYNADANDRMGKNNRRGQIGPENGMGRRQNAQNLDLNRDFVKLESPEARSLVALIDKVNPHLFIDCHTTNGSKHQYALTYDVPHNPATAEPIRNFLRKKLIPTVTKELDQKGTKTFYYGNFNPEHTAWTTFGHEPRFSTEYVGLRGRLAILSEAYSYISYKDRIFATKDFVSQCLEYVHQHANDVRTLLDSVDKDLVRIAGSQPSRIAVSLNAKVEKFDEKVPVLGYKDDQPHSYDCDFLGNYVPTRSVPLPYAYLVPAKLARSVDRMLMHGISVESLNQDQKLEVSIQVIKDLNRNERVFQKHRMLQAQSQQENGTREFKRGTFVVRTAQPLGRLAAYLLECESNDGLVFWNFLDRELQVDKEYPIYRLDNRVDLDVSNVSKASQTGRITLDMIGGSESVIPKDDRPRWINGQFLEAELWGRKLLLEPETMSFTATAPPAFESEKLVELLTNEGVPEEDAKLIADSKPRKSEDGNWLVFDTSKHDVVFNVEKAQVRLMGDKANNAKLFRFSPDFSKLAYVNQDGLNVLDLQSMKSVLLSPENPETELLGKLDWVYQEELYGRGNFKGFWFSPDSKHIAFLKLDESKVGKFTISDHVPVRGEDEFLSYPKAGDPNPLVAVGMASTEQQGSIAWVDLSKYDSEILVSNVSWRPDSSQMILQVQNREQTYLDLVAVDAMGSDANLLFQDKTPAWIDSPGEPLWLPDGSFVWLSPKNGYRHLYHFNADGTLQKQLTSGEWEVRSIAAFDAENQKVYFMAAKEQPYNQDAYLVDIPSGEISKLTTEDGFHQISFNEDQTFFIDSYSSAVTPPQHRLYSSDGSFKQKLNVSSDDRWKFTGMTEPEFLTVNAKNNQPLDAMIIRPPGFDPNKKYPVLIHVYSGPQAPTVRNRFGNEWTMWHQMLAQQGVVIWSCDNQSASYRSAKNAWPIHRDLGRNELADIELGIEWLKQQSWVDADRIGIWGWSYGGYMASYALTHSKSFKLGIAGAPVTDWRNYDTIYTERFMGLPQDNPEGYDASSVVKAAADLSGKLLIIHGSIDDNVHLSNTMQLALALQNAGKQFDLMIYPQNRHAIRKTDQAAHLRKLMYDFVMENL